MGSPRRAGKPEGPSLLTKLSALGPNRGTINKPENICILFRTYLLTDDLVSCLCRVVFETWPLGPFDLRPQSRPVSFHRLSYIER